ncbi:ATP-binding protein [Pradoshia sp.]
MINDLVESCIINLFIILICVQINYFWHVKREAVENNNYLAVFIALAGSLFVNRLFFASEIKPSLSLHVGDLVIIIGILYGRAWIGTILFAILVVISTIIHPLQGLYAFLASLPPLLITLYLRKIYVKIPINKKYTQAVLISLLSSIISMSLANVFFLGEWLWIDSLLYMLVYTGGLLGLVYYMENLKRSRILKREIINTEKLQAVSHLAASISHEVRNPLTATKGFLQLLKSDDNLSKEKKQQFIDIAISELNRAENIINDYLAFAKPSMELRETIEIQSEIHKVIEIVKPLANMNAVFIQCHVPVFYVNGEKHLFQQCFVNLVKNAIESMQGGGVLILRAQQNKKGINITITDTGIGMTDEQLGRLGEPYFSTKGMKGTGLGMVAVYRIVKSMHGSIRVKSKPQEGTTFTIYLPGAPD